MQSYMRIFIFRIIVIIIKLNHFEQPAIRARRAPVSNLTVRALSGWYLTPAVSSLFQELSQCVHRANERTTTEREPVSVPVPHIHLFLCGELKDNSFEVSGCAADSETEDFRVECVSVKTTAPLTSRADASFLR